MEHRFSQGDHVIKRLGTVALAVTAFALPLATAPGTALAVAPTNTIVDVSVVCLSSDVLQATVAVTHRGPAEVRIYGLIGSDRSDSDHGWFRGSGADTFVGTLWSPSPRQVEVHLLKVDHRASALVDVASPVTVGPYDCSS